MADQSDVEQTLAVIAAGVLYPLGPEGPSVAGLPCRVHRGWPDAAALDADLLANRITVTVSGEARGQRTTTRYPDEWRPTRTVVPTLQAAVYGATAGMAGERHEQMAGRAGRMAGVTRP